MKDQQEESDAPKREEQEVMAAARRAKKYDDMKAVKEAEKQAKTMNIKTMESVLASAAARNRKELNPDTIRSVSGHSLSSGHMTLGSIGPSVDEFVDDSDDNTEEEDEAPSATPTGTATTTDANESVPAVVGAYASRSPPTSTRKEHPAASVLDLMQVVRERAKMEDESELEKGNRKTSIAQPEERPPDSNSNTQSNYRMDAAKRASAYAYMDASNEQTVPCTPMSDSSKPETSLNEPAPRREDAGLSARSEGTIESPAQAVSSNEDLSVANLVEDESSVNLEATPVDIEAAKAKRAYQDNEHKTKLLYIAGMVLCGTLGFVLGFVVGNYKKQSSSPPTVAPSLSPSMLPSSTPSSAPSSSLNMLLLDLPEETQERIFTPGTPQSRAWEWMHSHKDLDMLPTWRKVQRFALATFFHAFEGENWYVPLRGRWMLPDQDECEWFSGGTGKLENGQYLQWDPSNDLYRPSCDEEGNIQILDLPGLRLEGFSPSVPPELALLTSLLTFAPYRSEVEGSIDSVLPTEFWALSQLTGLQLYGNLLTGTMPTEVGLLTNLRRMSFGENTLSGSIPSELGLLTSMLSLGLQRSSLVGSIPSEIGALTKMTLFSLYTTSLSGSIPSEMQLLTSLKKLYLDDNSLTGPINSGIGLLTNLEFLSLWGNALSGSIPSELGMFDGLETLYLDDNSLAGPIPSSLGSLSNLTSLWLGGNSLTGKFPSQLGLLSKLQVLHSSRNALSGSIPSQFGILRNLEQLLLNANALSGFVPSELGLLGNLKELALNENALSGFLPSQLGLAQNVTQVQLGMNALTGLIPSQLGLLTGVTHLFLSKNNFSGPLPSEELWALGNLEQLDLSALPHLRGSIGNLSLSLNFLNVSGSPNLSGTIPDELCFSHSQDSSCTYYQGWTLRNCSVDFDCSSTLCGCDQCLCS